MKPSVYLLGDFEGILRKNKLDVLQILKEMNGEDTLELVYETDKTVDISYAGTMLLAKEEGVATEVFLTQKISSRWISLARAHNPSRKITQFGAASYPITMRFSDEVIKEIVSRLATRNAVLKVIPRPFVLAFVYKAISGDL